jgi:DNA invertase Pin-like site-specific DNA recombinase
VRAVGYVRVSTQEQATEGVSLGAQEAKIRAYCHLNDLDLVAIYRDEGVSGTVPLADRVQGSALLAAAAAAEVDHVVAVKLDRLFRDAEDCLGRTKGWDRQGIALHLIDLGGQSINTSTSMGRFFLTIMAGVAELERNMIAERTTAALAHKKNLGEWIGRPPYGYQAPADDTTELVVDPREMEVVRLVIRRRERGVPYRRIIAELEVKGWSPRDGEWHPGTLRRIWERRSEYRKEIAREAA